ncbi:hypothetical protein T4B_12678 [Trichinella pseudospiralis]|uniref:Uncharacterized protein n=1 Tax=Trichinella pseudospiralis TaxID=6337 RepID=A0A0V1JA70_TRIPS|nr:hypothetical protein T4B_12678 [Trichinella pseudospiralis]
MFKSFKVSFARDLIERKKIFFKILLVDFVTVRRLSILILRMGDENIINMQVGGFEDLKFYNEPE